MAAKQDLRARLTVKNTRGNIGGLLGSGLNSSIVNNTAYTAPFNGPGAALVRTNGIIFPYTPNISVAHAVEYSSYELVHTNYQQNAYGKTRNPQIQVTGNFASQTPAEAAYTVGMMHFLRVVTKMDWGESPASSGLVPGTPPPVLVFSAYGTYNFSNVPVLVQGFNFVYEDGVDYVEVDVNGETMQIPSLMTVSLDLLPQYSPAKQQEFNMDSFSRGDGYRRGFI